ncbi:GDP-mannose pyrophosphatase NudK [Flavobacterium salilacus subsp. salilacus]|uniref:GDP-mannose pyrophosphatase NudK n=1 Tax=Flavobacterium TaxID=237 RepID=UPI001075140D|nr:MULTISPECIES: GDP-mannose pyrophosphatase NudK [Flavobacterium]KAF2519297.1 GDP-mannose pyrophosphatase NudK [Flavobacterium salilacus subsp. salilacus]MBE1613487.1 GDP-mannose pyrophosphatase NudK [Flavobacterium sp. SaA2.13]
MQDAKGNVKIISTELLSDNWGKLNKVKYEYRLKDGSVQVQEREVYDRGNGAVILLYNKEKQTVVLTRQLRIPTWFNGNTNGLMIEACAGMLDDKHPEERIKIEVEEETGYTLAEVKKIMEVYMSPGSVTEILYFFVAAYSDTMKTGEGGGSEHEQENIEVLEMPFKEAMAMIENGEIKDAKTIMLLQYAVINNLLG